MLIRCRRCGAWRVPGWGRVVLRSARTHTCFRCDPRAADAHWAAVRSAERAPVRQWLRAAPTFRADILDDARADFRRLCDAAGASGRISRLPPVDPAADPGVRVARERLDRALPPWIDTLYVDVAARELALRRRGDLLWRPEGSIWPAGWDDAGLAELPDTTRVVGLRREPGVRAADVDVMAGYTDVLALTHRADAGAAYAAPRLRHAVGSIHRTGEDTTVVVWR